MALCGKLCGPLPEANGEQKTVAFYCAAMQGHFGPCDVANDRARRRGRTLRLGEAGPEPCVLCEAPVEERRRAWVHPVCAACLPPPPPLEWMR